MNLRSKLTILCLSILALTLASCAGTRMSDGPGRDEVQSALSQPTPARRASALESLVPVATAPELRRDLLAAAAYYSLMSKPDDPSVRQSFIRDAETLREAIRHEPLYRIHGDEIVLAYLGRIAAGEDESKATGQVSFADRVAPVVAHLCAPRGWRPPEGSFTRRTHILYERDLSDSCRAWVKGDYRESMSQIARAAAHELSMRDMDAREGDAPAPSWIGDLGRIQAGFAPFAVFERRLKKETHISLDASLTRLQLFPTGDQ